MRAALAGANWFDISGTAASSDPTDTRLYDSTLLNPIGIYMNQLQHWERQVKVLVLYNVSVRDWKISGPNAAVMAESRSLTVNDWKEPSRMKGKQKVCARSVNLPSRPRDDHRKISAICEASACLDRNRWRL